MLPVSPIDMESIFEGGVGACRTADGNKRRVRYGPEDTEVVCTRVYGKTNRFDVEWRNDTGEERNK